MQTTESPLQLRLWTVEEYHRIAEAGIFDPSERVELLEGKIIWMVAKGTSHRSAVGRTYKLLEHRIGDKACIAIQDPVKLSERSEPEPDIAVVKIDPLDYADHHPTPTEIYLIIEVADSSLKLDTEIKAKAYSQAGIKDYWVLVRCSQTRINCIEKSHNRRLSKSRNCHRTSKNISFRFS